MVSKYFLRLVSSAAELWAECDWKESKSMSAMQIDEKIPTELPQTPLLASTFWLHIASLEKLRSRPSCIKPSPWLVFLETEIFVVQCESLSAVSHQIAWRHQKMVFYTVCKEWSKMLCKLWIQQEISIPCTVLRVVWGLISSYLE